MKTYHKHMALLVSVAILAFGLIGCSETYTGKYFNTKDHSEFIDINGDGTFTLYESNIKVQGSYRLEKMKLIFDFKMYGKTFSATANFIDGQIRDEQGKVWVKSSEVPPILISLFAAIIAIGLYLAAKKIPNKFIQGVAQLGAVFGGVMILVPFAEDPGQVREVLGRYYFYILLRKFRAEVPGT